MYLPENKHNYFFTEEDKIMVGWLVNKFCNYKLSKHRAEAHAMARRVERKQQQYTQEIQAQEQSYRFQLEDRATEINEILSILEDEYATVMQDATELANQFIVLYDQGSSVIQAYWSCKLFKEKREQYRLEKTAIQKELDLIDEILAFYDNLFDAKQRAAWCIRLHPDELTASDDFYAWIKSSQKEQVYDPSNVKSSSYTTSLRNLQSQMKQDKKIKNKIRDIKAKRRQLIALSKKNRQDYQSCNEQLKKQDKSYQDIKKVFNDDLSHYRDAFLEIQNCFSPYIKEVWEEINLLQEQKKEAREDVDEAKSNFKQAQSNLAEAKSNFEEAKRKIKYCHDYDDYDDLDSYKSLKTQAYEEQKQAYEYQNQAWEEQNDYYKQFKEYKPKLDRLYEKKRIFQDAQKTIKKVLKSYDPYQIFEKLKNGHTDIHPGVLFLNKDRRH